MESLQHYIIMIIIFGPSTERNLCKVSLDLDTKELLSKKCGRPLLIGEELDEQVRHYITSMRKEGTVINAHVVIAVGKGILMSHGKSEELTKDWARYVLQRMDMVNI